MKRARVAATDPVASAGAELVLADGGSASDAVVAGILTAGVVRDDVLLGPVVALVGGVGAGTRCFDGRNCQPGRGAKRPRGFQPGETIPLAARAGVPRSLVALPLMHSYSSQRPLSALVRCARTVAKQHEGADDGLAARLEVLGFFPQLGGATLGQLHKPLLLAAGAAAGGLMTELDLSDASPDDARADFVPIADAEIAVPSLEAAAPVDASAIEPPPHPPAIIVAADGRGLVAAACYTPNSGLFVPELGLRLSTLGVPVRRGVPRVTPGTPLWAPTPIALARRAAGWFAAIGVAGARSLAPSQFASGAAPLEEQLHALQAAASGTRAAMATVERGRTSVATAD